MIDDSPSFLITKEYKRFKEFCEACRRENYIGLCYGVPGVGKTLSARHYSYWDQVEKYIRANAYYEKTSVLLPNHLKDQDIIFYTAGVANSPSRVQASLTKLIENVVDVRYDAHFSHLPNYEEFSDKDYTQRRTIEYIESHKPFVKLLIIDESDRLKLPSIEQVRDFYDQNNCGLILIGMPGMEKRFSRYGQLYSRIGFVHEFTPLSQEEMMFIIQNHMELINMNFNPNDFKDRETIAAVIQITRGNFRLLNRLLRQVERIMKLNEIQAITKEVIFAARECLVVGQ